MLPLQFFGQNLHFAISLLAGLVFFAVFWLYLDAWTNRREQKELYKWAGCLLVAISFVIHAVVIEQSVLGDSLLGDTTEQISLWLRIVGYLGIIAGQILDPLQKIPVVGEIDAEMFEDSPETSEDPTPEPATKSKSSKKKRTPKSVEIKTPSDTKSSSQILPAYFIGPVKALYLLPPLGALTIAILYLRRATKGLERHLMPVGIAFFFLFAYELSALATFWRDSANPNIARLTQAFGPVWIAEHLLLLAGVLVLGLWVWKYLIKRFLSQLFMIFVTAILVIFLLTTVSFTFLLLRNIQSDTLNNLETATNVLNYAIDSKKAETLANSQVIAQNPAIAKAVAAKNHTALVRLTNDFLATKKQSSLVITSTSGQVLLRAEDPDRWGDSLSSDTLIRRALIGQSASGIDTKDDVLAPLLYIKTATPIHDSSNQLVGVAVVGLIADNAFVDSIKKSTGLDSAVYSGNIRSATTFLAPDGKTRWIGVKETNHKVQSTVLDQGQVFKGSLDVLNRPFLAVYAPLKDVDHSTVGMLFIGKPQSSILRTTGQSIELTFVVAAILLVLAIIPAYLISRSLASQLD